MTVRRDGSNSQMASSMDNGNVDEVGVDTDRTSTSPRSSSPTRLVRTHTSISQRSQNRGPRSSLAARSHRTSLRRTIGWQSSAVDLRTGGRSRGLPSETTPLLGIRNSVPAPSYSGLSSRRRRSSLAQWGFPSPDSLRGDQGSRTQRPSTPQHSSDRSIKLSPTSSISGKFKSTHVPLRDDRAWYNQFTSTDWVRDNIADAFRVKELRNRTDLRGRIRAALDGAQGWVLVLLIGAVTAVVAYGIDIVETVVFDYKEGYCSTNWLYQRSRCCNGVTICEDWVLWSEFVSSPTPHGVWINYGFYVSWTLLLAVCSCLVTLLTKTSVSSHISLTTLDENLAADESAGEMNDKETSYSSSLSRASTRQAPPPRPPIVYYPAAGSGVAEVKVILSGFVLHGYLGVRTLVCKSFGLILSTASGLSLGKEGPFVHIATCIGNIGSRLFRKYHGNEGKRREVLAASAAAGVAVAFGAPIGGVLFSLEEVSYYFPHKTLFRTFFCCIAAALSLKFLDPYGTGKIVLFEVRYLTDWRFFEIFLFVIVGALGGAVGALFIKASRFWAKHFRGLSIMKKHPIREVFVVAVATGLVSFWNRYTRLPVAEVLFEISSPCHAFSDTGVGLCPTLERIPQTIKYLCIAFGVKCFLTMATFGIKVPAGIYVPSMVIGGLLGRIIGHSVQWLVLSHPGFGAFVGCSSGPNSSPESCVVPGVYALVAAGATMCGVTRLSVTLAVILFELSGSLEHVLPFSVGVLVAKWTADAIEPLSIYGLLTDINAYPYLDSNHRPVFTTDLGDITPPLNSMRYIDISLSPLVPARHLRAKLEYVQTAGELDGGLPILRDGVLVGLIPAPDLEFALDRLEDERTALCLMSPQHKWLGPTVRSKMEPLAKMHTFPQTPLKDNFTTATTMLRPPHWKNQSYDSNEVFFQDSTDERHHDNDEDSTDSYNSSSDSDDIDQPLLQAPSPPQTPSPLRNTRSGPTDFTAYVDPAPVALDVYSSMDLVFDLFVKLGLRYICVTHEGNFAGLVHKKTFVRYVKDVSDGTEL